MAEKQSDTNIDDNHTTSKQFVIKESKPRSPSITSIKPNCKGTSSKISVKVVKEPPKSCRTASQSLPSSTTSKSRVPSAKATFCKETKVQATQLCHASVAGSKKEVTKVTNSTTCDKANNPSTASQTTKNERENLTTPNEKVPSQEITHKTVKRNKVNIVEYHGTNYDLASTIPPNSKLVEDQAREIENDLKIATLGRDLSIDHMIYDLSSLEKFVRLACCGVVGHSELQKKTREVLINVGDITSDTYHALKDFERTSKNALQTMRTAYGYLKEESLEREAFKMFNQIHGNSEKMCKISDNLSKKCLEESTKVNQLGDETLKEKEAAEIIKRETDDSVNKSKQQKQYHEEIMKTTIKQVDKKEKKVNDTLIDEKKVFEEKRKLAKGIEEKLQFERESVKQNKAKLKFKYDTDYSSVEDKIRASQYKYEEALLSNKNSYEERVEELKKKMKQKIRSAEESYKQKVKHNEEKYKQSKEQNDILREHKIAELKEKVAKEISDAEQIYKFAIKEIDNEYQAAIQTSNENLDHMLTSATQGMEAALEANKQIYSAKIKAYDDIQEEWSKQDAEEKVTNNESCNSARSRNVDDCKSASTTRDSKLNKASQDKQSKIMKAETALSQSLSSNKQSYEQTLEKLDETYKERIKFIEEICKDKVKQSKEKYQEEKTRNEMLCDRQQKEYKDDYDKRVLDVEADYQSTIEIIEKEYEAAIQASNDKLDKALISATQILDAQLKANEQEYTAKIKACWRDENKALKQDEWSKKDYAAKESKTKCESSAKSTQAIEYKSAQKMRANKLNKALQDKQSKIKEAEEDKRQKLLSNRVSEEEKLVELDKTVTEKITSFEDDREETIKEIEEELQQVKEEKEETYKEKNEEDKKNYEKNLCDAQDEYNCTITEIENEYKTAIKLINDQLENSLKSATQKMEKALEVNKQLYSGKLKALTDKERHELHEKWVKEDAIAKQIKSENEKSARSETIEAQKVARKTREEKVNKAYEGKQSKIAKSEERMNINIENTLKQCKELNAHSLEKKREENTIAESRKINTISKAKKEKQTDELTAKENKETADKSTEDIKTKEDDGSKSEQKRLLQKYQLDLQQIDKALENAEKQINDEYEKKLKIIDEKFQYLREKSAQYESDIKNLQKQREESLQKMIEFAQKIKDGLDLSKGQEAAALCLHEARSALNNIQSIMRNASNFWKSIGRHCKNMTEGDLESQINILQTADTAARKRVWAGDTFKEAALIYQGQWVSLKDKCALASEHITLVQDKINQYICENPTKEEALEIVQKLATDLLDSNPFKMMIQDKPAID